MRSVSTKQRTVYIYKATLHLSRSQHLYLVEWSGYRAGDRNFLLDSWKLLDSSSFQRVHTGCSVRQSSNSLCTGGAFFRSRGAGAQTLPLTFF